MTSFAIFLIILMIVAGIYGWYKGFLKQIGRLAGIILGIAVCRIIGPAIASGFYGDNPTTSDRVLYSILTYVVLFILVYIVVTLVAKLFHKLLDAVHIGILDHAAGALFCMLEWLILLSLLLNLYMAIVPGSDLATDPWFDRVLWIGPFLLGTETAMKIGSTVGTAIHG